MIDIIKRPIVNEKAMKLGKHRQYVFEVAVNSNKIDIKRAIEQMFEVDVISIRTLRLKGKVKKRMTRKGLMQGRTIMRKKAYITVKEGQAIDVVSGAVGE